ncbi:MAG: hypothetical protein AB200_02915 [Parcubacteria bacterium C7867-005]|nr:MAG: hypothetical protein AB200_02915 [Parcubacteria bacterium C7867-005]
MKYTQKQKNLLIVGGAVVVLILIILFVKGGPDAAVNSYLKESQGTVALEGGKIKVTGKFDCLPYKNGKDVTEANCVLGLKNNDGLYYALNTSKATSNAETMTPDDYVVMTGSLVRVEAAANVMWKEYKIEGILAVDLISAE